MRMPLLTRLAWLARLATLLLLCTHAHLVLMGLLLDVLDELRHRHTGLFGVRCDALLHLLNLLRRRSWHWHAVWSYGDGHPRPRTGHLARTGRWRR
jgi:hypothetical protein